MDTYMICTPCERCLGLLRQPPDDYNEAEGEYKMSVEKLRIAAAASCPICTRLLHHIDDWLPLVLGKDTPYLDLICIVWKRDFMFDVLKFGVGVIQNDEEYISKTKLMLYEYSPDEFTSRKITRECIPSSLESLDIMHWMVRCQTQHKCGSRRNNGYMPPRLLYCGNHDEDIHLVETDTMQSQGKNQAYATLSHCWGQAPPVTVLTTENYELLLRKMTVESLSKSFRDAVTVTRKLGLEYLWIDSLCIIQKGELHESDWQRHVRDMSHIYENGIINIAASYAKDSHGGLFRSALFAHPHVIDPSIKWRKHHFRNAGKLIGVINASETGDIGNFALNKRGWVCQERLMSPRTVHYDQHQIYWECGELVASSAFPNGNGGPEVSRVPYTLLGGEMDEEEVSSAERRWYDIVQRYSCDQLTNRTDRLAAIAAVAQKVNEQHFNDVYVAGVFLGHFCHSICFQVHKSGRKSSNMTAYVAPTWSWASTNGCSWRNTRADWKENIARLSSFSVDLIDKSNPYGQLRDASLTLTCAKWQLRHAGDSTYPSKVDIPYLLFRFFKTQRRFAEAWLKWDDKSASPWKDLASEVILLALAWDFRRHEVQGILVHPFSSEQDTNRLGSETGKTYVRIGVWFMDLRLPAKGAKESLIKYFGFKEGTVTLL
jgi:hypothetical protein